MSCASQMLATCSQSREHRQHSIQRTPQDIGMGRCPAPTLRRIGSHLTVDRSDHMGATLASWLLLGPIAECEAFILAPASSSAAASSSPREEIEKQKAKERYMKMHLAGKTEQAKADLARLAIIRKQREEAARKKEEERKGEGLVRGLFSSLAPWGPQQ